MKNYTSILNVIAAIVLLAVQGNSAAITIDYTYDALGRLTSVDYNNGKKIDYEYDPAGNILSLNTAGAGANANANAFFDSSNNTVTDGTGVYEKNALANQQEFQLDTDADNTDTDGDGTPDSQDSNPVDAAYQGTALGSISVSQNWENILLPSLFTAPVVIVGPPSFHEADTGVVRIRNVTSDGFEAKYELRFQEGDDNDGALVSETIPHLVLEEGRHVMGDGSIWEVGTYMQSGTASKRTQQFTQAFADIPELFLTLQTYNDSQAVTVRAKNISVNGFDSALYQQEPSIDSDIVVAEKVAYLAIFSPDKSGVVNIAGQDTPYIVRQEKADHRWLPILSSSIKIEQEKAEDTDVTNSKESISLLDLGGLLFAQDISLLKEGNITLRQKPAEFMAPVEWGTVDGVTDQWSTIPLSKSFIKPVVVARLGKLNKTDPAILRIRNVKSDSFQVKVQGWNSLDGARTGERIHYLVAEQGETTIAGLKLQAGKLEVTSDFEVNIAVDVGFNADYFAQAPAVFACVMSDNDTDAVTTRVDLVNNLGFNISLQAPQSNEDAHASEAIGWIAIEKGTGWTSDGRKIEISYVNANNIAAELIFSDILDRVLAISLGSLISAVDPDSVAAQQTAISNKAVSYKVNVEQSIDTEFSHASESISVFVAE